MEIVENAYAKLNLSLDVIKKLPSNYHEIDFVMQEIGLHDIIKLKKIDKGIRIKSNLDICPVKENTAYKAAKIIIEKFNITSGVKITIEKNIPLTAGLGGGSSDAAAVIKGMNKLFEIKMSEKEKIEIASEIGMDVPFFIIGGTAHVTGMGEKINRIYPLPKNIYFVLAKPNFNVSTKYAYENLDYEKTGKQLKTNTMISIIKEKDINKIANNLHNDFEYSICKQYPLINEIKKKMIDNGALNALMSGSGSSVFGVTKNKNITKEVYYSLKKDQYLNKKLDFVHITEAR
jgi:4-diphosphocytidyl-2-C-methyl-D-erythritol kinase